MDSLFSSLFRSRQRLIILDGNGVKSISCTGCCSAYLEDELIQDTVLWHDIEWDTEIPTGRIFLYLENRDGSKRVLLYDNFDDIGVKDGIRQPDIPAPVIIKKEYYEKKGVLCASTDGRHQRIVLHRKFITPPEQFVSDYRILEENAVLYVAGSELFLARNGWIFPIRSPPIKKILDCNGDLRAFFPDGNFLSSEAREFEEEITKGIDSFVVSHRGLSTDGNIYSIDRLGHYSVIFPNVRNVFFRDDPSDPSVIILKDGSVLDGPLSDIIEDETRIIKYEKVLPRGPLFFSEKYDEQGRMIFITNPRKSINKYYVDPYPENVYQFFTLSAPPSVLPVPPLIDFVPGVSTYIPPFERGKYEKYKVIQNIKETYDIHNIAIAMEDIDLKDVPFPGARIIHHNFPANSIPINPKSTWLDLIKKINDAYENWRTRYIYLENMHRDKDPIYLEYFMGK